MFFQKKKILPLGLSWGSSENAPKRYLKRALSTSHFFEDVSGETPIFGDPKIRTAISTFPFLEDVSGETLIFSIRRLKRKPPTSRFGEDVSSETLTFQTCGSP